MPDITAAAVKALREKTGLPMMDCKRALEEAGGDMDAAVEGLRKAGRKTMEKRVGRETSAGRIAVYTSLEPGVGAMIELLCESAPVANNAEFVALAKDLVEQLALGPGATTPDELLDQPSPSKPGHTLRQQFDDLVNRIREVFRLQRIVRFDGPTGGYAHHNGGSGVLLRIEGGNAELAKDISMHVAAMRPTVVSRDEVDPKLVEKEREIASTAARNEGKPEKVIPKIAEGKLKDFYAQQCLAEQIHPNKEKYAGKTVGQLAEAAGMKLSGFVHWELGKE
jgi:elongation factor Ts